MARFQVSELMFQFVAAPVKLEQACSGRVMVALQQTQQQQTQKPADEKPAAEQSKPEKPAADVNEVLKTMPVSELLKLKGVDEKLVTLYDLYEKTGSLEQYFKAYNTDYDKLDDLEVKKMQIRDIYKDALEPEEVEEMVQEAIEQYQLDADTYGEQVARRNKLKLKADVSEYRKTLKQRQQESIISAAAPAGQQQASTQQSEDVAMQEYAESVRNSTEFKELTQNGVLSVGQGDNAFNIGISHADVFDILTNPEKAVAAVTTPDGKTDYKKLLFAAAVQLDLDGTVSKLIEHGRQLEKIALAKELGNETAETGSQNAKFNGDDALDILAGKLQNR